MNVSGIDVDEIGGARDYLTKRELFTLVAMYGVLRGGYYHPDGVARMSVEIANKTLTKMAVTEVEEQL